MNSPTMPLLRLFGGASLEGENGPFTGPAAQRHRLALLALLAAAYPRGVPRERLMAWLWPERDAEHARQLLNQSVHTLRKALGEEAILSTGDELRLDADVLEADVIAFEAASKEGDLERAVGLYTGPFLDAFFLRDAPEFEEWAGQERERLRRAYARVLERLGDELATAGDPASAAEWWRRLAAEEPYNARVTLRLMEALDAAGDRAGALQQARVHGALMEQEFAAAPDAEVTALAERIRLRAANAPEAAASGLAAGSERAAPPPDLGSAGKGIGASDDMGPTPAPPAARHSQRGSWKRTGVVAATLISMVLVGWATMNAFGRKPAEIRRVAVLPLANLTGNPQQEYFVAGMHDALISELAQIEALTVYSRQSVLRYQGSDLPLPAIARDLGADALVEGSVFKSGDTVRITVQLVGARPERHLWAGSRQGTLQNALALQGQVARSIAAAIRARVAPEVHERLAAGRSVDPEAQQAYLLGLYHLERGSYGQHVSAEERLEPHKTAVRYLEEAVRLEPDWARAHAKLAMAYHWLASGFEPEYEAEYYPKSKVAALRALALDETESQAHASLGFVLHRYDWDWDGGERAIRRAIELDSNSHHWIYALYLQAAGRHDEAIAHYLLAQERNPLSEVLQTQIAWAYACAGRHDEAIDRANALQARARSSRDTLRLAEFIARQLAIRGDPADAIPKMEALLARTDTAYAGVGLAFIYALADRREEAVALAERAHELARAAAADRDGGAYESYYEALNQSTVYAALGEAERAVEVLATALDGARGSLAGIRCLPTYTLLREHPRMKALIAPVGFPR